MNNEHEQGQEVTKPKRQFRSTADDLADLEREDKVAKLEQELEALKSQPKQSPEELVALMGSMMERLVAEMRKPREHEQELVDQDRRKRLRLAKDRLEAHRREMLRKQAEQASCPHKDGMRRSLFRGQVNDDGYVRGCCVRCQKEFVPFRATRHEIDNGVGMEKWEDATLESLANLARQREQTVQPLTGPLHLQEFVSV